MSETWRLCITRDLAPALNMGLDEVLALEGRSPEPVLRLYTWRPATLSLGYFQRLADVPAARSAAAVVRRITGGGAIHHAGELTFSIGAPLEHPLFRGPVADSYVRVHDLLARALASLGVEAHLRRERALRSDRPGTGMCFHDSTPLDLCWGERKGVGSAQRRRDGRVLHHGSIKVHPDPLEPGVATLAGPANQAGHGVEDLEQALLATLVREWGIALRPAPPTALELEAAAGCGARYGSPAFVGRR